MKIRIRELAKNTRLFSTTLLNLLSARASANLNMAWRCSGTSNTELVENLWRSQLITDQRVKDAFLKVDRALFAPMMAYEDSPQSIGFGATISAPHMHASAVENLLPYLTVGHSGSPPRVLDIGSGSGYLTHLMAELIGDDGLVVGLEHIAGLRDLGERNVKKSERGRELINNGIVKFRVGDGRKGWVEDGVSQWDVIHVGAAAAEMHDELIKQLKAPGCMFIPVEDGAYCAEQFVWRVEKDENGQISKKKLFGVRYVPLTDPPRG